MKLVSKISAKTVCGKVKSPDLGVSVPLMRVIGIAQDRKTIETTYGESIEFKGQFKAVNVDTGEEFRAGKCFLPTIAEAVLDSQFTEEVNAVQFAFDIGVTGIEKKDGSHGYEYNVTPLVEMGEADPLAGIVSELPDLPQLEAPTGTKAPAKKATAKK